MTSLSMPVFPVVKARPRSRFDRYAGAAFSRVHTKKTLNDRELPHVLEGPSVGRIAAHHALDCDEKLPARASGRSEVDLKRR